MLIIVASVLRLLYFVSAVSTLLLGVSFTRKQRTRFAVLRKLDGKQVHLFTFAVGAFVLSLLLGIWHDHLQLIEQQEVASREFAKLRGEIADGQLPKNTTSGILEIQADRLNGAVSLAIRAEQSYQNGDYEEAIWYLKRADGLAAISAIKARIADCYFYSGDYVNAVAYESQAIPLAPDWSGPYYIRGMSFLRLGKRAEAIADLNASCERGFDMACRTLSQLGE